MKIRPGFLPVVFMITLLFVQVGSAKSANQSPGTVLRPIQDIHNELMSKFTPIDQIDGDIAVNHSGDFPFTGDCGDYYTAAFNQLYSFGYDPFAFLLAVKYTGKKHIVACVEIKGRMLCLNHNRERTSSVRDLKRLYRLLEKRTVLLKEFEKVSMAPGVQDLTVISSGMDAIVETEELFSRQNDTNPMATNTKIVLGDFKLDVTSGQLVGLNQSLRLGPRAVEVLVYLSESDGAVVSKETLHETVWTNRIVTDAQISKAINELRNTFDDHSEPKQYIETLPKRGYRLVATVTVLQNDIPKKVRWPGMPTLPALHLMQNFPPSH